MKYGKKGAKSSPKSKSLDDRFNKAFVEMKSKSKGKACPECGKRGCDGGGC